MTSLHPSVGDDCDAFGNWNTVGVAARQIEGRDSSVACEVEHVVAVCSRVGVFTQSLSCIDSPRHQTRQCMCGCCVLRGVVRIGVFVDCVCVCVCV